MSNRQTLIDLALNIFNEQIKAKTVYVSDCDNVSVDTEKYGDSISDIQNRLNVKLRKNGKCSQLLINQLARHQCGLGELFTIKEDKNNIDTISLIEFYQTSEILNLIENLELSVEGNLFKSKNSPLNGIYKIHHGAYNTLGASLVINVKNYWYNKNNQIRTERESEFDEIYNSYHLGSIESITNAMHQKAFFSKELTGEWLIYKKNSGINYYLCLAKHNEGDQEIYENKILKCYQEFSELI